MASEHNRWLQHVLAPGLKQCGYLKSGPTWRKRNDETTCVINIQGSQWSAAFHINLGVCFHAIEDLAKPNEYQCHVRARLNDIVPEPDRMLASLDFTMTMDDADRARGLERRVVEHGVRWLETVSTVEGARESCRRQHPDSIAVTTVAREFLMWSGGDQE